MVRANRRTGKRRAGPTENGRRRDETDGAGRRRFGTDAERNRADESAKEEKARRVTLLLQ